MKLYWTQLTWTRLTIFSFVLSSINNLVSLFSSLRRKSSCSSHLYTYTLLLLLLWRKLDNFCQHLDRISSLEDLDLTRVAVRHQPKSCSLGWNCVCCLATFVDWTPHQEALLLPGMQMTHWCIHLLRFKCNTLVWNRSASYSHRVGPKKTRACSSAWFLYHSHLMIDCTIKV